MPGSRSQPSQATKRKRKKDNKKKERKKCGRGGEKRGLKIIVRLRTERKRRKTVGSHKAGKGKIEGWRNRGMKSEN
jgi:hypothetical protein